MADFVTAVLADLILASTEAIELFEIIIKFIGKDCFQIKSIICLKIMMKNLKKLFW